MTPSTLRRLYTGLVGGTVATVVMTAFRIPISRSLPPTATFWAKYVGGGSPEDHKLPGLALHLAYGAANGALFTTLLYRGSAEADVVGETRGGMLGLAFGLVLSVFGVHVVLDRMLDVDLAADEWLVFHASHAIYGLTLGIWAGSRLSSGESVSAESERHEAEPGAGARAALD